MRVLKLPVNEYWYQLIVSGRLTHDYREVKPYWTRRLEGKEYDVVEFYHRTDGVLFVIFKSNEIVKG